MSRLFSAFVLCAALCIQNIHSEEFSIPAPFHYLGFSMGEEDLVAYVWSSGDSEETWQSHAMLLNVPEWIRESGSDIESKFTGESFRFHYLPNSLRSFCYTYGVNVEALATAEGTGLIDLAPYSELFSPIQAQEVDRILSFTESWEKQDDWIVHPRPEPGPPAWLNKPLDRKFYYEVKD